MSAFTGFFKRFTPGAGPEDEAAAAAAPPAAPAAAPTTAPPPAPEKAPNGPGEAAPDATGGGGAGGAGGGIGGFFSGPSRILDSVNAKSSGLMSDLSSKFDKLATNLNTNGKKTPHFKEKENDDDSSASEYGDGGDRPFYAEEAPNDRKGSMESLDSLPEDKATSMRQFMRQTVDKIISNRQTLTQDERSEFRDHCQHHTGRSSFAKSINNHQVLKQQKLLDEASLQALAHLFSVTLYECNAADDFIPARYLMDAAFTIHSRTSSYDGSSNTKFMFTLLKDQQIWQSTRFWNEALFEAVQKERTRQKKNNNPADLNVIAFPIVNVFTDRMMTLGLTKETTYDFVRKQYSNLELEIEQMREIKMKIKEWSPIY